MIDPTACPYANLWSSNSRLIKKIDPFTFVLEIIHHTPDIALLGCRDSNAKSFAADEEFLFGWNEITTCHSVEISDEDLMRTELRQTFARSMDHFDRFVTN